ncbi:MAG: sugar phosphate isomerase/epimerase [Clostridia bacterium]|nr:sugar phosphate isomerase/epimerase [Clostridia bacterium]MDE7328799.1 sugar phosphate isomerase/epimerase [Clostridia bacterium]
MKLGVSTATYFTRMYTEQALAPIAKLGAEVCEVFLATRSEYTQEFAQVLKQELAKARKTVPLEIHSVHALTNQFEPELFSRNDRAYKDALEVYEQVLALAKSVGATHYTYHGATMLKRAVKYKFDFKFISSRVNTIVELAENYGVKLCYENVHWTYFSHPSYFEALKKLCPDLGCTLDIKQARQSGVDYTEYLKVMAGRLHTVHLCDYDSEGATAIPGRGIFDFVTFFKRLRELGFEGACLMELYAKDYENDGDLKEAYEFLKDCLDRSLT